MKKYFAKYLPVEGEIKEGDVALNKQGYGLSRVGKKVEGSIAEFEMHTMRPYESDVTPGKMCTRTSNSYKQYEQKVKLFLCSRDIQADDELYYPEGVEDKIRKEYNRYSDGNETYEQWFLGSIKWILSLGVCKVIGQISPEATWVKEGDEFNTYPERS